MAAISPKQLGLTSEVMAKILKKETELSLRLETIWFGDSRDNREFLFGRFVGKKKSDETIVTLAERFNKKKIVALD